MLLVLDETERERKQEREIRAEETSESLRLTKEAKAGWCSETKKQCIDAQQCASLPVLSVSSSCPKASERQLQSFGARDDEDNTR